MRTVSQYGSEQVGTGSVERYGDGVATEITVRGTFVVFEPPERGTVHATVAYEGPEMEPVYGRVARDLDTLKTSIGPLQDPDNGPVTWWSTAALRTWTNRPWNQDGKQLPLVHHASVGVQVKFSDFAELSRWVTQRITAIEGFRVSNVEWTLTGKRRAELQARVRTEAVRDAVDKARQYATALDLVDVRPVGIADAGMLGADLRPAAEGRAAYARAAAVSGGPDVELAPEDIEISAAVDARFVADRR
jgi:hypothetical protein